MIKYYTIYNYNYVQIIGIIRREKRARRCYPATLKFRDRCINTAKT